MRYQDDKALHEIERASQDRSKRGLRIACLLLALTFLIAVAGAEYYYGFLRSIAPAVGGGLPELLSGSQDPIAPWALVGLAGIVLSWLGLELVGRTLRRP